MSTSPSANAQAFFDYTNARRDAARAEGRPVPAPSRWDAFLSEPAAVVFRVAPSTVEDALPDYLRDAFATAFRLQSEQA